MAESFGNASFTSSPITKINGEDAKEYLENWAQFGSLQDRDALYNNVFYELATVSLGPVGSGIGTFAGSGRGRWVSDCSMQMVRIEIWSDLINRFTRVPPLSLNSRMAPPERTPTMPKSSFRSTVSQTERACTSFGSPATHPLRLKNPPLRTLPHLRLQLLPPRLLPQPRFLRPVTRRQLFVKHII